MSGKITVKRVRQTQLDLINGTLHCHMFRGTRYEVQ